MKSKISLGLVIQQHENISITVVREAVSKNERVKTLCLRINGGNAFRNFRLRFLFNLEIMQEPIVSARLRYERYSRK